MSQCVLLDPNHGGFFVLFTVLITAVYSYGGGRTLLLKAGDTGQVLDGIIGVSAILWFVCLFFIFYPRPPCHQPGPDHQLEESGRGLLREEGGRE